MAEQCEKIDVHNPDGLDTVPYSELRDMQGDLKVLFKEEKEKLTKSIRKHGIFVPFFVWEDGEGVKWIMDGHQRTKVLSELEAAGVEVPPVPIGRIEAEGRQGAAEKLLQINSQYGKVNPTTSFFEDVDLDKQVLSDLEIPNLEFTSEDYDLESPEAGAVTRGEVEEAEDRISTREKERQDDQDDNLLKITCPHCMEDIFLPKDSLRKHHDVDV